MPKTVKSWWWIALALVVVGSATLAHHAPPARAQSPRVTVEFWHGLAMPLGGILEKIVVDFNESQTQYQVNPTFKGSYPETMVAAIAAFRAGNAPHVVQMFEVGTATMMSARGATVSWWSTSWSTPSTSSTGRQRWPPPPGGWHPRRHPSHPIRPTPT